MEGAAVESRLGEPLRHLNTWRQGWEPFPGVREGEAGRRQTVGLTRLELSGISGELPLFGNKELVMNKPLPKITCPHTGCWRVQTYTGQTACKSCERPLTNFNVAVQLGEAVGAGCDRYLPQVLQEAAK